MRTMVIFKGLPGCGKSTLAAEMVKSEPKRWVRINRDDLRAMVSGPGNDPHVRNDKREELMRSVKNEAVRLAFKSGFDVILDDTHLVPATVKKLHELAMGIGDVTVIEKGVNVDVETCIARDSKRTGFAKVGEKIIRDMASFSKISSGKKLNDKETHYPARWIDGGPGGDFSSKVYDPSSKLPKAIMCDLDGTLAIISGRSPYDATDCDLKDKPNWPVIEAVLAMHAQGVKIIFMSGRDVKYRPETVRFIEKYCRIDRPVADETGKIVTNKGDTSITIPYELHMRGELDTSKTDMRKDNIIKEELFAAHVQNKYNVLFVLDDRDQVVDQWRKMGLSTFQVAPGAF